jgi:hypothetical protein
VDRAENPPTHGVSFDASTFLSEFA